MSVMDAQNAPWTSAPFRQLIASKIEEDIQRSKMTIPQTSVELENNIFKESRSKEEYLSLVAQLLLNIRERGDKARSELKALESIETVLSGLSMLNLTNPSHSTYADSNNIEMAQNIQMAGQSFVQHPNQLQDQLNIHPPAQANNSLANQVQPVLYKGYPFEYYRYEYEYYEKL